MAENIRFLNPPRANKVDNGELKSVLDSLSDEEGKQLTTLLSLFPKESRKTILRGQLDLKVKERQRGQLKTAGAIAGTIGMGLLAPELMGAITVAGRAIPAGQIAVRAGGAMLGSMGGSVIAGDKPSEAVMDASRAGAGSALTEGIMGAGVMGAKGAVSLATRLGLGEKASGFVSYGVEHPMKMVRKVFGGASDKKIEPFALEIQKKGKNLLRVAGEAIAQEKQKAIQSKAIANIPGLAGEIQKLSSFAPGQEEKVFEEFVRQGIRLPPPGSPDVTRVSAEQLINLGDSLPFLFSQIRKEMPVGSRVTFRKIEGTLKNISKQLGDVIDQRFPSLSAAKKKYGEAAEFLKNVEAVSGIEPHTLTGPIRGKILSGEVLKTARERMSQSLAPEMRDFIDKIRSVGPRGKQFADKLEEQAIEEVILGGPDRSSIAATFGILGAAGGIAAMPFLEEKTGRRGLGMLGLTGLVGFPRIAGGLSGTLGLFAKQAPFITDPLAAQLFATEMGK